MEWRFFVDSAFDGFRAIIFVPCSEFRNQNTVGDIMKEKIKGRILVMDDETMFLEIINEILTENGFSVVCVDNGEEALKEYRNSLEKGIHFNLAILDLSIKSGIDGLETLREMKKLDESIQTILCSGHSLNDVVMNYRQYGFDAKLTKPFEIEELLQTVEKILMN